MLFHRGVTGKQGEETSVEITRHGGSAIGSTVVDGGECIAYG